MTRGSVVAVHADRGSGGRMVQVRGVMWWQAGQRRRSVAGMWVIHSGGARVHPVAVEAILVL